MEVSSLLLPRAAKQAVDGQAVLQPHCPDFSVTPKHMLNRADAEKMLKAFGVILPSLIHAFQKGVGQ